MRIRELCLHILTKIAAFLVVSAVIMFATAGTVYAQENDGVFAKHSLDLKLETNLTATASYTIDLTNNNQSPVNSIDLQLPFADIHNVKLTINNENESVTTKTITGGTELSAEFPGSAILHGQTKSLKFSFITNPVATSQFGLTQFYIGKVNADHVVSEYSLHISYPDSFPPIIFTSSVNLTTNPHEVLLSGLNAMMVQWADNVSATIQETVPVDLSKGQENTAFNLLRSIRYQEVAYTSVKNLETAGDDAAGNLWGVAHLTNVKAPIAYDLEWQSRDDAYAGTALPTVDYGGNTLDLPPELGKFTFGRDKQEILQGVYDYMSRTFSASGTPAGKQLNIGQTLQQIKQGDHVLTDLQFAYVTAAYCQKLGVTCNVVYGYLAGPNFASIDTTQPHAWVEAASDDNKLVVMDPFLELSTGGFNYFGVSPIGRIAMGVWDPRNTSDSALGIISLSPRIRPSLNPYVKKDQPAESYTMQSTFPAYVRGGEFYFGYLTVQNQSNNFVGVKSLVFDNADFTKQLLEITPWLQRVFTPFSTTRLDIVWQREPNFLIDGTRDLKVVLTPESDLVPELSAQSTIKFIPNSGALTIVLIIIVVMILVIIGIAARIVWQDMQVDINLRKRYRHRQAAEKAKNSPPPSFVTPHESRPQVVHKLD